MELVYSIVWHLANLIDEGANMEKKSRGCLKWKNKKLQNSDRNMYRSHCRPFLKWRDFWKFISLLPLDWFPCIIDFFRVVYLVMLNFQWFKPVGFLLNLIRNTRQNDCVLCPYTSKYIYQTNTSVMKVHNHFLLSRHWTHFE